MTTITKQMIEDAYQSIVALEGDMTEHHKQWVRNKDTGILEEISITGDEHRTAIMSSMGFTNNLDMEIAKEITKAGIIENG